MRAVGVVELGIAQPHLYIRHTLMACRAVDQRAELRANRDCLGIGHRIAQKVGRQLLVIPLLAQRGKGAMQLGSHGIHQNRRSLLLGAACCR